MYLYSYDRRANVMLPLYSGHASINNEVSYLMSLAKGIRRGQRTTVDDLKDMGDPTAVKLAAEMEQLHKHVQRFVKDIPWAKMRPKSEEPGSTKILQDSIDRRKREMKSLLSKPPTIDRLFEVADHLHSVFLGSKDKDRLPRAERNRLKQERLNAP